MEVKSRIKVLDRDQGLAKHCDPGDIYIKQEIDLWWRVGTWDGECYHEIGDKFNTLEKALNFAHAIQGAY